MKLERKVWCQARRPIEFDEFSNLIKLLRTSETVLGTEQFETSCILSMHWHLIVSIDDLMKMRFENIKSNVQNYFTSMCKMRWSKNITEERNAPEQIILGSMDMHLFPVLNLVIYFKIRGQNTGH